MVIREIPKKSVDFIRMVQNRLNQTDHNSALKHKGVHERYSHLFRAISNLEQLNEDLANSSSPILASPQVRENNAQILKIIHTVAESEDAWRKIAKQNNLKNTDWFG